MRLLFFICIIVSAIQDILLAEPTGLTSREIAHRLVLKQAPYSTQSSGAFIKVKMDVFGLCVLVLQRGWADQMQI